MGISPDGKTIVTSDGRVIDIASGRVERIGNVEGDVRGLHFSPDGKMLVIQIMDGDGGMARLLEFPSGKKLAEIANVGPRAKIAGAWPKVVTAGFTPDSRQILLMGKDGFVRRYDPSGKELLKYEPAHTHTTWSMVVSPDGQQLASAGSQGDIYLWELESGKLLHRLEAKDDLDWVKRAYSLAFSPDGRLLAGGGVINLLLWDTSSGQVKRLFPQGSGEAVEVRFSGDGGMLTTVYGFKRGDFSQGPEKDTLSYPWVAEWGVEAK
jgi:WD40 repeat protein